VDKRLGQWTQTDTQSRHLFSAEQFEEGGFLFLAKSRSHHKVMEGMQKEVGDDILADVGD
jgi:hypothetical protein